MIIQMHVSYMIRPYEALHSPKCLHCFIDVFICFLERQCDLIECIHSDMLGVTVDENKVMIFCPFHC